MMESQPCSRVIGTARRKAATAPIKPREGEGNRGKKRRNTLDAAGAEWRTAIRIVGHVEEQRPGCSACGRLRATPQALPSIASQDRETGSYSGLCGGFRRPPGCVERNVSDALAKAMPRLAVQTWRRAVPSEGEEQEEGRC